MFKIEKSKEIEKKLDRTLMSIQKKAQRLGLKKDNYYYFKNIVNKLKKKKFRNNDNFANFISGFVAGEGYFISSSVKGGRKKFIFGISLADIDIKILEKIKDYFKVGHLKTYDKRKPHYHNESTYSVQSIKDILEVIIPFFEMINLQGTHKEEQFKVWKKEVQDYIQARIV